MVNFARIRQDVARCRHEVSPVAEVSRGADDETVGNRMPANPTDDAFLRRRYDWEFFISHVKDDTTVAQRLKAELDPPSAVFLDVEHIAASDQWRAVLSEALRSSLVYVFLIPRERATYTWQDEEMTIADHLYRNNQQTRRIVPIYLGRDSVPSADEVPFGLARFSGMALPNATDLSAARQELHETLVKIKPIEAQRIAREDAARETAERVTSGGWSAALSSTAAAGFLKPLFTTLIALMVATTLALIGCAVASIWTVSAGRALVILGVLLAALIALTLTILTVVLRTVVDISKRGIKGA